MPENKIESKSFGGDGVVGNKRAPCWKDFKIITPTGHLKPKPAYNLCVKSYACHSKNNGTTSLTHHLKNYCTNYPMSNKFTGTWQKILSFQKKKHNDQTSAKLVLVTFSADACGRALVKMIIIDELSFSFAKEEGFQHFTCRSTNLEASW